MSEATVRRRATVRGRVQGVGFRMFAVEQGGGLGLRGTVANRPDGSVECVAEGPAESVDRLLELLRRGPGGARVSGVDVVDEAAGSPLPPMRAGW